MSVQLCLRNPLERNSPELWLTCAFSVSLLQRQALPKRTHNYANTFSTGFKMSVLYTDLLLASVILHIPLTRGMYQNAGFLAVMVSYNFSVCLYCRFPIWSIRQAYR